MNIYYWIWNDTSSTKELQEYCGGTTVVAANSEEEAKQLVCGTILSLEIYSNLRRLFIIEIIKK